MAISTAVINEGNVVVDKSAHASANSNGVPSAVMHRSLQFDPLTVRSAKGHVLELTTGQRILDATGGAAVCCIGHGNERVRDAIFDQMNQVSYCHSLFYATRAAEDLARFLIDSTDGVMQRAFFISSGSEAMEAALKLARQFHLEKPQPEPSRVHFIARHQSYHGTTLGALGVGGHVARRALFEPILGTTTSRVSPCYAYRGQQSGETEAAYIRRLEDELEAEFQRIGPSNVAAFIAEPVVGAALGCVPSVPGYFAAARRVCDRHGALLIFDEVMSGVGRVGPAATTTHPSPLHAWQDPSVGVAPDIQTLGKGLGGGYMPIAAVLVGATVVDALTRGSGAFSHGQTYQAHPLACRAALEVQRVISEEGLVENVRVQGERLGRLLRERLGEHPSVGDIRGQGLFWGLEFVRDKANKTPFDPSEGVAMGIHELGMEDPYNISVYPGSGTADGRHGDHILLAPAYNSTSADIDNIVDITAKLVENYFATKA